MYNSDLSVFQTSGPRDSVSEYDCFEGLSRLAILEVLSKCISRYSYTPLVSVRVKVNCFIFSNRNYKKKKKYTLLYRCVVQLKRKKHFSELQYITCELITHPAHAIAVVQPTKRSGQDDVQCNIIQSTVGDAVVDATLIGTSGFRLFNFFSRVYFTLFIFCSVANLTLS